MTRLRALVAAAALSVSAGWLSGCWWTPNPGPAAFDVAARPLQPVGVPASGPVTYVQVTVRAGTAFDPPGKEGLSWLTAQLLRDGGAGARSPEQVDALLDELGTDVEVVVDRELVTLRTRALHEDVAEVGALLADMVLRPSLDPQAFARLRDQSVDQLTRGALADDEALGLAVLEDLLFAGHPYGHPLRGRAGVVPTLSLADVRAFREDRWVRPAVTLGLAGPAVDGAGALDLAAPGGPALAALRDQLSTLPPRLSEPPTPRKVAPVAGRELLLVEKPTESVGVHFGHPLVDADGVDLDRGHPDWPALVLAFTALGEHRQSHGRLYRALRGERGLNYGDYAYIEVYRQAGWSATREVGTARVQNAFYTWLRPTTAENGPFALKAAVSLVEDFVRDGLTPAEFARTRDYLRGRVALWADHPGRRLGWAVEARALGTPDPIVALPAALDGLTLAQVNEAVRRHIRPEDLRIVVVTGDAAAFEAAVTGDAPTPLVVAGEGVAPGSPQATQDAAWAARDLQLRAVHTVAGDGVFR